MITVDRPSDLTALPISAKPLVVTARPAKLSQWGADTVVLALGLDAFVGDPFAGLAVTTRGFAEISTAVRSLGLPTVIIQEGGYLCPELGRNLSAVLEQWA